ncbi:fibronectin type III domain-containing protein [Schlegelella sp. S2-27]|uniref:Fibronectin type III domain-containing protein n=1 Tax=Caldimonas mangrovi TaxID=2944811 RepID=A0ABT0YW15_9BURK|nr:fibronectin type III domain-containing protein [Caldimonas mangrovi]MCM5682489.1 fibronectin type III domain-containing protein [Caldimonas mangrovi]
MWRWEWQGAAAALVLSLAACGGGGGGGGGEPGPDQPPASGPDTTAPSAPANLGASAGSSSRITLNWTASTDNVGVTGYRVERCQGAGCSSYAQVATPSGTSYTDNGLAASTSYSYRVYARDTAGNASAASAAASAITPASSSGGPDATTAGVVTTPFPTLQNLSVEWAITGDDNLNGVVTVRYRKQGASTWRRGLPLRRVPAGSNAGFSWANRHSGSVFDLDPGSTYEIELSLDDPDGGSATRTVTAATRRVPAPAAGGTVKAVTPATFSGVAASAQPGDILELGAGSYGGFTVAASGTASQPLVIRSSAGAVVNGNIELLDRAHVQLDGLTVNGRIRFNRSNHIAITRCTINTTGDGIVTFLRSENAYIADNVITGATTWAESSLGVDGNNVGEGVIVTGPGHVIMNNRIRGFRDGVSFLEQGEADDQYSIDVLNNDIRNAADDAIEADYCFHNCRILRNRITNAFQGISSQPSLGGPTYHVRNAIYNAVLSAFKLNNTSIGDVLLHNTVVKNGDGFGVYAGVPVRHLYARNNLFIGGPGGSYNGYSSGSGRVVSLDTLDTATSSLDHDGYGYTTGIFSGRIGGTNFSSLAQLRSNTSEKNAVQLGLDVFNASIAYPASPMTAFSPPDLRLETGSAAVDAGVALPNVSDGYGGSAPDLGAYEAGAALPAYGPR